MCCVGSTPTKYMLCFEQYLAGEYLILSTILLSAKTFKVQLGHTVYLWNHNLPLWEENLPFIPPCRWYRCDPQARVLRDLGVQGSVPYFVCSSGPTPLMLYLEFSGATLPISGLQLLLLLITTGTILNFSFHICWCYANKTELNIFEDYSTPFKNNQHEKWPCKC